MFRCRELGLFQVKVPYQEIKRRILGVEEDKLTQSFIEQLINLLPDAGEFSPYSINITLYLLRP